MFLLKLRNICLLYFDVRKIFLQKAFDLLNSFVHLRSLTSLLHPLPFINRSLLSLKKPVIFF